MKTLITILALVTALTTQARPDRNGNQQLEIDFGGQLFQGQSTIYLKQEIRRKHPRINFDKWDLKRVVLVAKSARGFGEAYLQTGRQQSRVETVDGNRYDFQNRGNYHRIAFRAPGQDKGHWQLHMQGRIKVNKVIIVAKNKQPRRPHVTRSCSVVLETVWGKDIKKFHAQAQGPRGSGVSHQACTKAMRKCNRLQNEIPLTRCEVL